MKILNKAKRGVNKFCRFLKTDVPSPFCYFLFLSIALYLLQCAYLDIFLKVEKISVPFAAIIASYTALRGLSIWQDQLKYGDKRKIIRELLEESYNLIEEARNFRRELYNGEMASDIMLKRFLRLDLLCSNVIHKYESYSLLFYDRENREVEELLLMVKSFRTMSNEDYIQVILKGEYEYDSYIIKYIDDFVEELGAVYHYAKKGLGKYLK